MKFEIFKNDEDKSNEEQEKVKVIGHLSKSCYESNCGKGWCNECGLSLLETDTLQDLHNKIIDAVLNSDSLDQIAIDSTVLWKTIENTITSVKSLKEDFKQARDAAAIETMPSFIESIRSNMKTDISTSALISLINLDNSRF